MLDLIQMMMRGEIPRQRARCFQGTRTILPWAPEDITTSWARAASLSGISWPTTGRSVPWWAGRRRARRVPQHHAEDGRVAHHGLTRVDLHGATIADDHDAAAQGEHAEIPVEVDVGEHLHDEIDPAPAGDGHDSRRDSRPSHGRGHGAPPR
jgi:hypothetical protein